MPTTKMEGGEGEGEGESGGGKKTSIVFVINARNPQVPGRIIVISSPL